MAGKNSCYFSLSKCSDFNKSLNPLRCDSSGKNLPEGETGPLNPGLASILDLL